MERRRRGGREGDGNGRRLNERWCVSNARSEKRTAQLKGSRGREERLDWEWDGAVKERRG